MEQSPIVTDTPTSLLDKFFTEKPICERTTDELEIALIYLSLLDLSDPSNQAVNLAGIEALLREAKTREIVLSDGTSAAECLPKHTHRK